MGTVTHISGRRILRIFPAGDPRGSWPAERFAAERRAEGVEARVVMDLITDQYIVFVPAEAVAS